MIDASDNGIPVWVYDAKTKKLIGDYRSFWAACKNLLIGKSIGMARQKMIDGRYIKEGTIIIKRRTSYSRLRNGRVFFTSKPIVDYGTNTSKQPKGK